MLYWVHLTMSGIGTDIFENMKWNKIWPLLYISMNLRGVKEKQVTDVFLQETSCKCYFVMNVFSIKYQNDLYYNL